ncbi:MAG: hypothetical protein RSB77_05075 [Bacilli bacterium]
MPSGSIHICIANKVYNEIKTDYEPYIIGAIAPDCWRHSKLHNDKMLSHFSYPCKVNNINIRLEDYKTFIFKYKNYLKDPFVIGYLVHLMTDNYWKTKVISRYNFIIDNKICVKKLDGTYFKGTIEEVEKFIHKNNKILTVYLTNKYQLKRLIPYQINSIIEEIDLSGINTTINHINETLLYNLEEESLIYDMNLIDKDIENITNIIVKEIKPYLN